jgi:chemotaxis signal transduction protein
MSKQVVGTKSLQLIRCFIGKETYCLDTFWVKAVQNSDELTLNKNSETPIGWVTYEQQKITIFSLAMQLKQPLTEEIFHSKVIIFNSKPIWGILVDRVSRVFEVAREKLFSLSNIVNSSSVSVFQGIVKVEDEMLLYLDPQYLHPQSSKKLVLSGQTRIDWETLIKQKNTGQYLGQILTFAIGNNLNTNYNLLLGLSVTQVLQVLKSATIRHIPMSPEHILGFINWQNIPIPVVDLNLYLGLESNLINSPDTRFLIARAATSEGLIAIAISPLVKTLNLPIENNPIVLPFLTNKPFCIKSFKLRDEVLVILDIDGIIGVTSSASSV